IHDATLRRTTDRLGRDRNRTAAELRRARLRGPDRRLTTEHVPMLEEVLAVVAAADRGVLVEGKGPGGGLGGGYFPRPRIRPGARNRGTEGGGIAGLSPGGVLEGATVMSFNPAVIEPARRLVPRLRTTLLVSTMHVRLARARPADTVAWALKFGATDVGLKHTLVDENVITAARASGVRVGARTVNDESEMRRLIALDVDVLTSDRPDLALRALGRV